MLTLDAMRTDASNRRQQLTQFPAAPNPPTWSSFASNASGFQVVLIPPTVDGTNPYLAQGIGLDFPATNQNQQNQSTASINNPTFLYQVQLATDAGFTQNVNTYDLGTSTTTTLQVTGSQFARARAKFVNSPFSDWRPFGSGVATNAAVFRPFEFSTTGAVAQPFQGMDGDTNTAAGLATSSSVTYGPFYGPATAPSGLTLFVVSAALAANGTIAYSVDAGNSFTTLHTGSWSKTTDSASLSVANLGLVRVKGSTDGTGSLTFYETYIQ